MRQSVPPVLQRTCCEERGANEPCCCVYDLQQRGCLHDLQRQLDNLQCSGVAGYAGFVLLESPQHRMPLRYVGHHADLSITWYTLAGPHPASVTTTAAYSTYSLHTRATSWGSSARSIHSRI